ncbi:Sugar fermentation stimulation protein-like protein [Diplonema papillatum]|nr:Sugar fermentation stimulation protein-like protein [Diplonema papillatum]KAJ9454647.1 Sugar fermentation stimulation protein-like protein [Diplonema papillatum]
MSVVAHTFKGLVDGLLLKRYKRFLCDVQLADGSVVTCHMANPGSMLGMCVKNAPVKLSHYPAASFPQRKLRYGVEAIRIRDAWVGLNTAMPNKVVGEMLHSRMIKPAELGLDESPIQIDAEVPVIEDGETPSPSQGKARARSRLDFKVSGTRNGAAHCVWIEVKMVTMSSGWHGIETETECCNEPKRTPARLPAVAPAECGVPSRGLFPDATTTRGLKHLGCLSLLANRLPKSSTSILLFFTARGDVTSVGPSLHCDPAYAERLKQCCQLANFRILPLSFEFSFSSSAPPGIRYQGKLPFVHPKPSPPSATEPGEKRKGGDAGILAKLSKRARLKKP